MSKQEIKIASELSLPLDAVTQTFAQIARKGGGKTYLASMIAEQMLDAKAQVIVIDPVGNWWGLRVDADGKSKGKDIYVIGGEHGDVPLVAEAGKEIARILVESRISCVLDVSELRKHERKRFLTDFGEEFFHLKKSHRTPVHIFLEEAHTTIPQRVERDDARMVGAWEDIVRLGRNYGIGCSLISQRPQSINKEVLSQVECLCVLQTTGLHERKALEEWVQEAGADRKLIGELPGLARGEGYVWSPGWLKVFKRVHFLTKTTFDTSATPKLGEAIKAAKISKVDVAKLREVMQSVVAKASAEKLKEKDLVAENTRLRKELAAAQKVQTVKVQAADLEEAMLKGARQAHAEAQKQADMIVADFKRAKVETEKKIKEAMPLLEKLGKLMEGIAAAQGQEVKVVWTPIPSPMQSQAPYKKVPLSGLDGKSTGKHMLVPHQKEKSFGTATKPTADVGTIAGGISPTMARVLEALARIEENGVSPVPKEMLAAFAKLKPSSSNYRNILGNLRSQGLIDYPKGGYVTLTEGGEAYIPGGLTASTEEELQANWREIMTPTQARVFDVLIEAYPDSLPKDTLAERASLLATSSNYRNVLGSLRTMGAIDYPQPGTARASDNCFMR